MKKVLSIFIAAAMMLSAQTMTALTADTDDSLVYESSFSNSALDAGLTLANSGYFKTSYVKGAAGKEKTDVSLNFIRDEASVPSTESSKYYGNNIYSYVFAPVDKAYVKYEINFMPGNDNFRCAEFATQGHSAISPEIYCTDSTADKANVLNRDRWNRITYIIKNNTIPVNTTSAVLSYSVDLYVNGTPVCTDAPYTAYKKNKTATETTMPLRFAVYGKDTNVNGTTTFVGLSCYMDDITVNAYDTKPDPAVRQMPYIITDGNSASADSGTLNVYENTTPNDLTCSDGATITVYDTSSYDYYVVGDNPLYEGNLIVLRDTYGQMSYYKVHMSLRNVAELTGNNGTYTAKATLKDACLVLAGYESNGRLSGVKFSANQGDTSLSLTGQYGIVKTFILKSIATMMPIGTVKTYVPNASIACWGDSLTISQGCSDVSKTSYPAVLASLSGCNVYNMGVGGETAMTIAARQGGVKIKLDEAVTIPGSGGVNIKFSAYNDDGTYAGVVTPRNTSQALWNPCVIDGVEGTLSVDVNSSVWPRVLNSATFTRSQAGSSVAAAAGDSMTVAANDLKTDINVIFSGTNGGWNSANTNPQDSDANDLVVLINKMIAKTKYPDKYVVIGLTAGGASRWAKTNAALKNAYGDRFLNIIDYLASTQALQDLQITPTDNDIAYIAAGKVPPSLLNNSPTDDTHLNDNGYKLLANKVHEKLIQLGYIEK